MKEAKTYKEVYRSVEEGTADPELARFAQLYHRGAHETQERNKRLDSLYPGATVTGVKVKKGLKLLLTVNHAPTFSELADFVSAFAHRGVVTKAGNTYTKYSLRFGEFETTDGTDHAGFFTDAPYQVLVLGNSVSQNTLALPYGHTTDRYPLG